MREHERLNKKSAPSKQNMLSSIGSSFVDVSILFNRCSSLFHIYFFSSCFFCSLSSSISLSLFLFSLRDLPASSHSHISVLVSSRCGRNVPFHLFFFSSFFYIRIRFCCCLCCLHDQLPLDDLNKLYECCSLLHSRGDDGDKGMRIGNSLTHSNVPDCGADEDQHGVLLALWNGADVDTDQFNASSRSSAALCTRLRWDAEERDRSSQFGCGLTKAVTGIGNQAITTLCSGEELNYRRNIGSGC